MAAGGGVALVGALAVRPLPRREKRYAVRADTRIARISKPLGHGEKPRVMQYALDFENRILGGTILVLGIRCLAHGIILLMPSFMTTKARGAFLASLVVTIAIA